MRRVRAVKTEVDGESLTIIAEFSLVDKTALSLPGDVGHPDGAYIDAVLATCV